MWSFGKNAEIQNLFLQSSFESLYVHFFVTYMVSQCILAYFNPWSQTHSRRRTKKGLNNGDLKRWKSAPVTVSLVCTWLLTDSHGYLCLVGLSFQEGWSSQVHLFLGVAWIYFILELWGLSVFDRVSLGKCKYRQGFREQLHVETASHGETKVPYKKSRDTHFTQI